MSVAAAAAPRRPARPVGVPARPRRPARAGPAGPGRPVRGPGLGAGRPARARGGRHRRRRPVRDRPVQLLPRAGVQHLRRPRPGRRRPARADRSPAACRSSAAPATTTRCTPSPRPSSGPASAPGSYGLVGANGGVMSKYSAGIYSTTPAAWRPTAAPTCRPRSTAGPRRSRRTYADGPATIETYTVKHARDGAPDRHRRSAAWTATAAASSPGATTRTCSTCWPRRRSRSASRSTSGRSASATGSPPPGRGWTSCSRRGQPCCATATSTSSSAATGTCSRSPSTGPEARNSLHPMANDELDHVFDAYFADDDLWVAILTGAGDKAFSAGNDLVYSASGQPMWVPKNGFAGLTSRATCPSPSSPRSTASPWAAAARSRWPATWSWPTRPPSSRSARSGSGSSRARAAWSGCPARSRRSSPPR